MTCDDVGERLDDYIDGTLAEADREEVARHMASCASCREEERDLRSLVSRAADLPREIAPRRDLWSGVARETRGEPLRFPAGKPLWSRPLPLLAAAAALVAASSAVTAFWMQGRTETRVAVAPSASLRPASYGSPGSLLAAEREYAQAASDLMAALDERRSSLPPETLQRVEQNLKVIDAALDEVRGALRKDPDNADLTKLLTSAHKRKVDALRRVVRLASL